MTTAFVAGATGLVGREVVRALRERDVAAHAHVRPASSRLDDWRARFEGLGATVDATPWEADAMGATIARVGPDVVFALLGTTQARQRRVASAGGDAAANTYEAVDYGLTKLLLDAVTAGAPGARFVYLSAIGADGGRGAYMAVRKRLEGHLREGDVPWTVARPSFILGDRDEERKGEALGAAVTDLGLSIAGLLGAGRMKARYASIQAPELARGLVRLGLDPEAAGQVYETDALRG